MRRDKAPPLYYLFNGYPTLKGHHWKQRWEERLTGLLESREWEGGSSLHEGGCRLGMEWSRSSLVTYVNNDVK